jgi:hypothetical protein
MTEEAEPARPTPPLLRIVRGEPSAEELAALVAVLAARSSAAVGSATGSRTDWNRPSRLVRQPVHADPGGWRASALPR